MLVRAVIIGVQRPGFAEEFIFGSGYTASTGVFLVQVWRCAFTGCTSQKCKHPVGIQPGAKEVFSLPLLH